MKKILFIILCCLATGSYAQDYKYYPDVFSQYLKSNKIADSSGSYGDPLPATMHDRWADVISGSGSGYPSKYYFKSVQDYIKIGINHDTSLHVAAYTYAVTLRVYCYTPAAPGPSTYDKYFDITLNISYNPDSLKAYNDIAVYKFSNYQKIQVFVTSIMDISTPSSPTTVARTSLGRNFYIESDVIVERYDVVTSLSLYTGSTSDTGSLKVNWVWGTSGSYADVAAVPLSAVVPVKPVLYELEWTYIDDYQFNLATATSSYAFATAGSIPYDFRKNSTRVQTYNTNYAIPLLYEHGAIIYRIRSIRPDPSSGYLNPLYSQWSMPDYGSVSSSATWFDASGYVISKPHTSDSLNWQYTINFAEEGKYKHVINYFDGSLKGRQTQTKINTDQSNIIVLDKVYDFEGRPSIQTLPTPVPQTYLGYRKDISINAFTSHPYKAADFDKIGCSLPDSVSPLSSTAWANIYYSPLNPDKSGYQRFVPDAKGYPFIETLYYPDNTNKVLWQGGAGIDHQLWKGHGTRYEYVRAQQVDIDKLLGTEAGYYEYYPKQIVTDPNGQTSYSILNPSGKVVVTGLIGIADTATGPVDLLSNYTSGDTTCSNVLEGINQQQLTDRLSAENTFYSDKAGTVHLQYSASVPAFNTGCSGLYLWAKGKYKITVSTDCGVPVMSLSDTVGSDSVLTASTSVYTRSLPKDTILPKAKYQLDKDLIYDRNDIRNEVSAFVYAHEPSCYYDSNYFIRRTVDSANFPCTDTSAKKSLCDLKKEQMKSQLWPGAKYGQYTKNSDSSFASGGTNSIFTAIYTFMFDTPPVNKFCRYTSPCVNFPDTVWYNTKAYTNIRLLPVDTFIMIFNDAMADSLLPLHPEYCRLQNCDDGAFENLLNSLVTYQQAVSANMFVLDSIIHHDPIWLDASSSRKTTVYNQLAYFSTLTTEKIDQVTLENVYCGAGNTAEKTQCIAYLYKNEIQNFIFVNNDIKQQYFNSLKQAYIANRTYILQMQYSKLDTTCSKCGTGYSISGGRGEIVYPAQMKLSGTSVFNSVLDTTGKMDTTKVPAWIANIYNAATSGTLGSSAPAGLSDSLNAVNNSLMGGQVDAIMGKLNNCSLDTNTLNTIKAGIYTACGTCTVITPAMVTTAITGAGLGLNDLCNPFLAPYNEYNRDLDKQQNYLCGKQVVYNGMSSFFNRSTIGNAIRNSATTPTATYSVTLSPASNPFEYQIYSYWSDSSITASASVITIGGINYIDLRLQPSRSTSDTFDLYITAESASAYDLFSDPYTATTYTVDSSYCLNNESSLVSSGYVAQNTAIINLAVTHGSAPRYSNYLVYSRKLNFMSALITNNISNCITCVDMRNAIADFKAHSSTYGYDTTYNHPLFEYALTNYLNVTLNKSYSFEDYNSLMNGCALSDKTVLPRYFAMMETVSGSDTYAGNIINNIASATGRNLVSQRIKNGSQVYLLIDLNSVPKDSIAYYSNIVSTATTGNGSAYLKVRDNSIVYAKTLVCVDTFSLLSSAGTVTTTAIQIMESGNYENYKMYSIATSGTSPITYAKSDSVISTFVKTCPGSFALYNSQLSRTDDYGTTDHQNYLNYVYSVSVATHSDLLDSINATYLQNRLPGYASLTTCYDDPYCDTRKTDFYVYAPVQSAYSGYKILYNSILQPSAAVHIFPDNITTSIAANLKIYKKANGYYWYRYFDAGNHIYNVYINPPANTGITMSSFRLDSMHIGPGKDSTHSFVAYVSTSGTNVYACKGYADFTVGYSKKIQNVILQDIPGSSCTDTFDCEYQSLLAAEFQGNLKYKQYFDSVTGDMSNRMMSYYVGNAKDSLTLCASEQKYQYTVYYYDRAGNLSRTVPPAGVSPLATSALTSVAVARDNNTISSGTLPLHTKVSYYRYDVQNKLRWQQTPDGGTINFYYDAAGRLVFSQNSKQKDLGRFSYTLYDGQGRPFETGEAKLSSDTSTPTYVVNSFDDGTYPMTTLVSTVQGSNRYDVVSTSYDVSPKDLSTISGALLDVQENLRKRVAAITYYNNLIARGYATPTFTIYYSYDMTGNVKTVTYDFPVLADVRQRYKRVDYDYDVLSGKINMLSYNRGHRDQFYHKYDYDADNRITKAYTSNDGYIWNTDARYSYYKHGPLANLKIGDLGIQSIEYAYTIQGWLKAMNSDVLNPTKDMGQNGQSGDLTYPRDVVAHALDYFKNDYYPIDNTATVTNFSVPAKSLFNGNIVRQTTSIAGLGNMQRNYRYDQLQRLKLASNANVNESTLAITPSQLYQSNFTYDPDGNILTLNRKDTSSNQLDSLAYNYATGNNQLQSVTENAVTTGGTDIKPGQPSNNYQYDKIGNLIKDQQGHIKIDWTPYGKVRTLSDTVQNQFINFTYDGKGDRIFKEIVNKPTTTSEYHKGEYYVYDAAGNILAIYNTHNSYAPLVPMTAITSGISGLTGFSGFLTGSVSSVSSFSSVFQNTAIHNAPTWTTSQTNAQPVSFYMANSPSIQGQLLMSTDTYLNPLRDYDQANSTNMYTMALTMSTNTSKNILADVMMQPGTESFDMLMEYDINMPDVITVPLWSSFGLMHSSDPVMNATNLQNAMNSGHLQSVIATQLASGITSDMATNGVTNAFNFYDAVVSDNSIFQSTNLRNTGPFEAHLESSLNSFAPAPALDSFFNQWIPAQSALNAATTINQRFAVLYNSAPAATIDNYIAGVGISDINTTLSSLPDLTAGGYYSLAAIDPLMSAGVPSSIALALGEVTDTISLASHIIYGSNRLGDQRYDTTHYRNTYNINSTVTPIRFLDDKIPWYSYKTDDLSDSNYASPYNHMDVTSSSFGRVLGKRYYEISDHLGNVLATVLDRKTGHKIGGTGTTYDYWLADLANVSDYYPGGMSMPQRNLYATDTSQYRFAFNGKFKDNEVYGLGNLLNFGDRMYDSRLDRPITTDRFSSRFPDQSPYVFAGDNPIYYIDKNGDFKLDPSVAKYPLVYKYISTQLEKDVQNSADIYRVYETRTNAKRDDIARDFKNNSGVGLIAVTSPGQDDAFPSNGPEHYSESQKAIEVNEKVLGYVEGILKNPKSSKLDKQQALLLLNVVIFHSEAHNLEDNFGMNDQQNGKGFPSGGEAGYDVEYMLYGIHEGHMAENENKQDKISGVQSKNDKLKKGVTEHIVNDAQGDKRKTSNLPTVTN